MNKLAFVLCALCTFGLSFDAHAFCPFGCEEEEPTSVTATAEGGDATAVASAGASSGSSSGASVYAPDYSFDYNPSSASSSANSSNFNYASQGQSQYQGQGQGFEAFNGNTSNVEVLPDFDKRAERAAAVAGSESGCHTGASASTGQFGTSLGGPELSCKALRLDEALAVWEAPEKGTWGKVISVGLKIEFVTETFFRTLIPLI